MKYILFLLILFLLVANLVAGSPKAIHLALKNSHFQAKTLNTKQITPFLAKPEKKDMSKLIAILLFIVLPIAIGIGGYFLLSLIPISTLLAILGGLIIGLLCFLGIGLLWFSTINIC